MSAVRNPYDVLGLPPDSDLATIKRAFRTLAREHHPDRSRAPGAEARFRELVEAYELLAVPQRRRREPRVDISAIVSFYAWLAGRQAPSAERAEAAAGGPVPSGGVAELPQRRVGERGVRVAAAAGLLYAVTLVVLLLTR
jgi:curved DNA-binding protein CbpA